MTLANHRWEQFAQAVATGASAAGAYRQTYGTNGASAEAAASRLLRNGKVNARVAALQAESAKACVLTIEKRRELLARFAQDATEKTADRIRALELDARLAGHLKGDSVSVQATAVSGWVCTEAQRMEAIARKKRAIARGRARMAAEGGQANGTAPASQGTLLAGLGTI